MPQAKRGQSDAQVAARDRLDTLDADEAQVDRREQLEDEAKQQEQTQKEELSAGKGLGSDALGEIATEAPAIARAGVVKGATTQGGFMDQLSRRNGLEGMEGHYVTIDSTADGVQEAYERAQLFDKDVADDKDDPGDGFLAGFYGVYITRGATDEETGIPLEVLVRLRDNSHAVVTVPYEAVRHSEAQGR